MAEIIRTHIYHAEATALKGRIILPLQQDICPQTHLKLREEGGYSSQSSEAFRVGQAISYRSAYTQVAGNVDTKKDNGWSTLATSVVEGLNILDVLTADRVVAQVSTVHPRIGHVPSISFLGTRFENLRIAGHEIKPILNLDLLANQSDKDRAYTDDSALQKVVGGQHKAICAYGDLPSEMASRYSMQPASSAGTHTLHGSLVKEIQHSDSKRTFGHLIHVPNFGDIYLAKVAIEHADFEGKVPKVTLVGLTMISVRMGCIGSGDVDVADAKTNGRTQP